MPRPPYDSRSEPDDMPTRVRDSRAELEAIPIYPVDIVPPAPLMLSKPRDLTSPVLIERITRVEAEMHAMKMREREARNRERTLETRVDQLEDEKENSKVKFIKAQERERARAMLAERERAVVEAQRKQVDAAAADVRKELAARAATRQKVFWGAVATVLSGVLLLIIKAIVSGWIK